VMAASIVVPSPLVGLLIHDLVVIPAGGGEPNTSQFHIDDLRELYGVRWVRLTRLSFTAIYAAPSHVVCVRGPSCPSPLLMHRSCMQNQVIPCAS
jgi:hypothetical protein